MNKMIKKIKKIMIKKKNSSLRRKTNQKQTKKKNQTLRRITKKSASPYSPSPNIRTGRRNRS